MKKFMIPVSVVTIAILLLAFVNSDSNSGEVLMIRGVVVVSKDKDFSCIKIYKGAEKVETIALGQTYDGAAVDGGMDKIIQTVNRYSSEGYEVISSTEVNENIVYGTAGNVTRTVFNFILKK